MEVLVETYLSMGDFPLPRLIAGEYSFGYCLGLQQVTLP